jgi:hypothetical protein
VITFDPADVEAVASALDARGWVNLRPDVAEEDAPPEASSVFGIFGARGPVIPLCTWHPGERSAGVQHATGPKVVRRIDVPAGWRVVQDHPRRGLVVRVPPETSDTMVLRWLVDVGTRLCPVPMRDEWVAELHQP